MNTEQTPNSVIKDSLTTDTTFDLEWAKLGGIIIDTIYDDEPVTYVQTINGYLFMSCMTGEIGDPNTDFNGLRMATRAECDAAGVEYIEPPVSESAVIDRVAMWLYDESYTNLSAQEKLSIIAHYPPIRATGKKIGDFIEPPTPADELKALKLDHLTSTTELDRAKKRIEALEDGIRNFIEEIGEGKADAELNLRKLIGIEV